MITGVQLKEIRKNFGLKIREVSRATFISESAISNIENDTRQPSLDTLEVLANFYGYEIELSLVEKKSFNKKINFYKPKSLKEILELSKEDLIEYIFVTQNDEVISRLVNIKKETLEYINLRDLRNILNDVIQKLDNLYVYYKMEGMYEDVERDVIETINYFVKELDSNKENASIAKFLSSIYYIDLGVVYDYEYEEWDTYFDDIKVYDKNRNLIGTSNLYVDNDSDNDYITSMIEEMVVAWRNDSIDNQDLMCTMKNLLQVRFK